MDVLLLIRVLHIFAVVLLLGNLLMAPFWRQRLAAAGAAPARALANRSVRVADLLFTLPGWVLLLATGILHIVTRGWPRPHGWLDLSLSLFVVWLVLWHVLVLRARKAMMIQADEVAANPHIPAERVAELGENERQWQRWSYVSAALVGLILILMVLRPF